jgi:uncharacterized membrane protein
MKAEMKSEATDRNQTSRMIAATFALIGTLIALYLLLHDLGLSSLICPIAGCDKVQASQYSKWFGIPVAAFGLAAFVMLLGLSVIGLFNSRVLKLPIRTLIVTISGLGLIAYIPLTYLELFVIRAICFWCVASSLMMLGVLLGALWDRS